MTLSPFQPPNPWPRRLALLLACAIVPLLGVGGLVTTYRAGMAVPDWPATYGYNLFLYPWTTWFFGPFDLFIEHGHRLLGAAVGVLAVALVAASWMCRAPRRVRVCAALLLAAIVAQGVLGGLRVLENRTLLAKIHGCTGPLVLALALVTAMVAGERKGREAKATAGADGATRRLVLLSTLLAYLQIVLGAQLRHLTAEEHFSFFRGAIVFHLFIAAALAVHVAWLTRHVRRQQLHDGPLVRGVTVLAALFSVQIVLGMSTWVVKYGWPVWFGGFAWSEGYVVQAEGFSQALLTTAHVVNGAAVFATAAALSARVFRPRLAPWLLFLSWTEAAA